MAPSHFPRVGVGRHLPQPALLKRCPGGSGWQPPFPAITIRSRDGDDNDGVRMALATQRNLQIRFVLE